MADQESNLPASDQSCEVVAKDGDLILVVGTGERQLKIQVYSQCLTSASKVFRAMLTPPWKEDRDLVEGDAPEVLLPEDDPDAMRWICHVIHHQKILDGRGPSPERLLRMAVVSDKYDLYNALEAYVSVQLNSIKPKTNLERLYCYAAMSRFSCGAHNLPLLFDLVGKQRGPFAEFMDDDLIGMTLNFKDICKRSKLQSVWYALTDT